MWIFFFESVGKRKKSPKVRVIRDSVKLENYSYDEISLKNVSFLKQRTIECATVHLNTLKFLQIVEK